MHNPQIVASRNLVKKLLYAADTLSDNQIINATKKIILINGYVTDYHQIASSIK